LTLIKPLLRITLLLCPLMMMLIALARGVGGQRDTDVQFYTSWSPIGTFLFAHDPLTGITALISPPYGSL